MYQFVQLSWRCFGLFGSWVLGLVSTTHILSILRRFKGASVCTWLTKSGARSQQGYKSMSGLTYCGEWVS